MNDPYIIQLTKMLTDLQDRYAQETRARENQRDEIRRIQTGLESTPDERYRTRCKSPNLRRN